MVDINPDIQLLKRHIQQASEYLQQREGTQAQGSGSLIYLGNQHDSIPRNLLLDPLLESAEIHTWALLRIHHDNNAMVSLIPRQEDLMELLKCSRPVLSRHLQVLRTLRWITFCHEARGSDGKFKGHVYVQHDRPLSLQETVYLDSGYIDFLEQPSTGPVLKRLRQVKQSTLLHTDFMMLEGIDLNRVPSSLEQAMANLKPGTVEPDINTSLAFPAGLYGHQESVLDHQTDEGTSAQIIDSPQTEPVDIERISDTGGSEKHHVKSFYTAYRQDNRVKKSPKKFYMDTSSSSSYIKTTTTERGKFSFPKALSSERTQTYALRILSTLEDDRQMQFALDYLSDRIKAGDKGSEKPVDNPIRYLNWIVTSIKSGSLPESSYGIRNQVQVPSTPPNDRSEEDRLREQKSWERDLRDKGYEFDPKTGVPVKMQGKRVGRC